MYDLAALEAELTGTIYAGKLHYSCATGSTNSDAMRAARSGAPDGSVYFADEQLAGRGRGDHGWVSAAGEGLYASVLLRPRIATARLPLVPLAAGLAAADAIRAAASLAADLRWPNDLLIGPRKVGGILVESILHAEGPPRVVVGIGINVHQQAFPPDLSTPATSLDLESGTTSGRSSSQGWKSDRRISRQILLLALLKSLERESLALASPDARGEIVARIERASLWMRGRSVEVHGPQACSGVTDGLDENGFLRVMTANGIVIVRTGGLRANE